MTKGSSRSGCLTKIAKFSKFASRRRQIWLPAAVTCSISSLSQFRWTDCHKCGSSSDSERKSSIGQSKTGRNIKDRDAENFAFLQVSSSRLQLQSRCKNDVKVLQFIWMILHNGGDQCHYMIQVGAIAWSDGETMYLTVPWTINQPTITIQRTSIPATFCD